MRAAPLRTSTVSRSLRPTPIWPSIVAMTSWSASRVTPICSHTLTDRPIVLPGTDRIEVTLLADQEVMATMDGQIGVGLKERDTVEVRKGAARIRLVHFPHKDFFSVLRTKLKWGER